MANLRDPPTPARLTQRCAEIGGRFAKLRNVSPRRCGPPPDTVAPLAVAWTGCRGQHVRLARHQQKDQSMSDTAPPPARPSNTTASSKRENRTSSSALASSPSAAAKPVRKVHTILAPKGGCGKTYVASLIAQALQERGEPLVCFDTDRENASPRDIAALHNGATSFAPLSRYLVQDGIADAVGEAGKKMVVHTIVAGGQELIQTTRGFDSVASQFPASAEMVLWLNEHHGPVDGADGASFEQTPVYQKHRGRILAVVRLARQHPGTFGANLADMLTRGLTFAEADQSSAFFVIAKQRLRQVWRPIRDQLAPVL
jgi:hypothetical protein